MGERVTKAQLDTRLRVATEALRDIAFTAGECGIWDMEAEKDCEQPAVYFEDGHGAFGQFNLSCELHADVHRAEIEKAKSKGSWRGRQAPIDNRAAELARDALVALAGGPK